MGPQVRRSCSAIRDFYRVINMLFSLLTTGLHLLHIGVDRVDDLGVRIGFAMES